MGVRPVVGSVAGPVAVTAGAVVTVLGSSMAWVRTGRRSRSSFEVFGLVDRLGFSPSGVVGWAIRLWPIVPLLAVSGAVLAWSVRGWLLRIVALVTLVYAGGVGFAVTRVDDQAFVSIERGPAVTLVGASLIMAGALVATFGRHGDSRRGVGAVDRTGRSVRDR